MSQDPFLFDPYDVFRRPWDWLELPREKAMMQSCFVPVVAVLPMGVQKRAELLSPGWNIFDCQADDSLARFYTQVGFHQPTAAKGPVPVAMNLSTDGADFIGSWEGITGYNATSKLYFPYNDQAGLPTIGYGHLITQGEDFSKGLTLVQVDQLFIKDSARIVKNVVKALKVKVSQNQFDAVTSLAFNYGTNTRAVRHLNAGKAVTEADFLAYNHIHVKKKLVVSKGLTKRRKAEWIILSKGIYDASH